jgi:nucleotide-binding universal stress UspA family protein
MQNHPEKREPRMLKRILAATARPHRIDPPVVSALKLAAVNRAELIVLHVVPESTPPTASAMHVGRANPDAAFDTLQVLSRLHQNYRRHLQVYDRIYFKTGRGMASKAIAATARRFGADAIFLGPHDPGRGFENQRPAVTGTAQGILHDVASPVLIVNRNISARMVALQTIVACVDFSESGRLVLSLAARMAHKRRSRILALHMHGIPPFSGYSQRHYRNDLRRLTLQLNEFTRRTIPGIPCEHAVVGGSHPHLEILKFARDRSADLIVMGSRPGLSNRKWYAGSAVEKVSLQSFCPVAVAPSIAR